MQLTAMDVHQLIKNPSGVALDTLASKVVVAFTSGSFSLNESAIAADIFRLLLRDTEKSVRMTLAEHLYNSEDAPHDVIFRLACDETDVAERILQYSPLLTDDDLIFIVKSTREILNLCAIAKREKISENLSDVLINTQQEAVLNNLFNNKKAKLSESSLINSWDMIASSSSLLAVLVGRGGLPLTIAEKMFALVSDELKQHLTHEYKISPSVAQAISVDAREWELLGIMPVGDILHPDYDGRVEDLVAQLYASGRLTYSLIIRALCVGFLNLFEASLARLSDIPRVNARILLMGGHDGFKALYETANMPEGFADAVEKLLEISHKITKYGCARPQDFRKKVIENIYVEKYHLTIDGMGYLLSIIDGRILNNKIPHAEIPHVDFAPSGNYSSFAAN